MASHHQTVAKASLVAACLRADVTKLGRDDIDHFHSLLEASLLQCSSFNVQKCKIWLLNNIIPSLHRTTALGRYLTSISKHISATDSSFNGKKTPPSRQHLHILYVIHDVFHHAKFHEKETIFRDNLEQGLGSFLADICATLSSSCKTRVKNRLYQLLKIWEDNAYFETKLLQTIRVAIGNGVSPGVKHDRGPPAPRRDLPYIMPVSHGDPSVPFYDLPAANLMPHIVPNAAVPMRPEQIKPLQLSAGPAEGSLVRALKDFLQEVDALDNPFTNSGMEGISADMDELGQLSYRNEDDVLVGDTYYGWSRGFCEKMRNRGRDRNSRSRSRSPISPRKRRRHNSSRSWSDSASSPRRARSRSYSPIDNRPSLGGIPSPPPMVQLGDRQQQGSGDLPQPFGFPPPLLGPNNVPIPPPRPLHWSGPWPPPLPTVKNLGPGSMHFGVPPPPPPPPPPHPR